MLANIREKIKRNKTAKTENLIRMLNPVIRGWANYYRHVCSKLTFAYVDSMIFQAIWRWAVRRHHNKGARWVKEKYFRAARLRNWIFYGKTNDKYGKSIFIDLIKAAKVSIKRHIKIKAAATPYDPDYREYLEKRNISREMKRSYRKRPIRTSCCCNLIDNR